MINTSSKGKIINILIVDDDEDDFIIIREFIEKIGGVYVFNIVWCPLYKDALSVICEGKYEICFIDFFLGVKTGLDLIKEAIDGNCEKPLILLTGLGNYEIDIRAMETGAMDYLIKSELNPEKLERCIRYALSRSSFINALKVNEQKFRSIFEQSTDCIFTADQDLFFTDVNQAGCILFEYSKPEFLRLGLFQLLVYKDDYAFIIKKLSVNAEISGSAFDLLTKSEEKIKSKISISKEIDSKGKPYIQGIIHDITALIKSEKAKLQTEKFKLAERLIRVLAHEIRNPLTNIDLSSHLLLEENDLDGRTTYVNIIKRNSKRIDDLITQFLDSSRLTEIVLAKISLQSIMEASIAAATDRITLKFIKLERNYPEETAWIMADAPKLEIAFLNIIINAIESIDNDKGKLIINIKSIGLDYIVSVRDNGKGISEENLTRLFEPYYTTRSNGMGLGLSATLNIIQSHKALVEVQSIPEHGTVFIMTFNRENGEG